MKKRLISLLSAFILLASFIPAHAATAWDGFAMADAEVNTEGGVTITSKDSSVSFLSKNQTIPSAYEFEATIKIDSFSGETGIQVSNGKFRLFVFLTATTIKINGGTTFAYAVGGASHDYYFAVSDASASLYVDGVYLGTSTIQTNTMSGRMYFWCKSLSGGQAVMKVSDVKLTVAATTIVSKEDRTPTKAFRQDWSDEGEWTLDAPNATLDEAAGEVNIDADTVSKVFSAARNLYLSENFDYEYRAKVNAFGGETGAKIEWNPYRIFFYMQQDQLGIRSSNGIEYIPMDIGYEYHTYKVEVRGDSAKVYVDAINVASFKMQSYALDLPIMSFWVKPVAGTHPNMTVDYADYKPVDFNIAITAPLEGSEFLEGTCVTLKSSCQKDTVDYYANDILLGSASAPTFEYRWEDAPEGIYTIYAKSGEEASLPINISVRKSFGGNIMCPKEITYGEALNVECETFCIEKGAEIADVTYFINGKEVSTANAAPYGTAIENLKVGGYTLSAIVTDKSGVSVKTADVAVSVQSNGGGELCGEYMLSYTYSGSEGQIFACDGFYSLNITHSPDALSYGEGESYPIGAGEYKIIVSSGEAELYYNGQFALSFNLTSSSAQNSLSAVGVENFIASAAPGHGTYFESEMPQSGKIAEDISITQSYVLEFDRKGSGKENITVFDGGYELILEIADNIVAKTAPLGAKGDLVEDTLCAAPMGYYRIEVCRGIAQIYINNAFVASLRLNERIGKSSIAFECENPADTSFVAVRKFVSTYFFDEDFDTDHEIDGGEYFNAVGVEKSIESESDNSYLSLSGSGSALLNLYAQNPQFSLDARVSKAGKEFFLTCSYLCDSVNLKLGYNFVDKQWEIRKNYIKETLLKSVPGDFPSGEWANFKLNISDDSVSLECNGQNVISASEEVFSAHGRLGVILNDASADIDNVSYFGDGKVSPSIDYFASSDFHTVEFLYRRDNSLWMIGSSAATKVSSDDGLTWQNAVNVGFSNNTLRLHSGAIVVIKRVDGTQTDTYWDEAYVSTDDGNTYSGPVRVETRVSNRVTMNNKLIQAKDGRIYFCAGESGHAKEKEGALCVYYSDDDGRSWKESETPLTIFNTGVNVQEGKVIELPDGTLRCYMRTDRGFIYTSDSRDRGVTWDLELKKTQFISTCCALNIERDAQSDTYYMAWEYDNTNCASAIQYPRNRIGLAVSRDGCKTWQYAMDVTLYDYNVYSQNHHANVGIRVFDDVIFVSSIQFEPYKGVENSSVNRVFRINKSNIRPLSRFSRLQAIGELTLQSAINEAIKRSLIISKADSKALVFGESTSLAGFDGKMIDADVFARYLGGRATRDGANTVISFGSTKASLDADGNNVSIVDGAKAFSKFVYEDDEIIVISEVKTWSASMIETFKKVL